VTYGGAKRNEVNTFRFDMPKVGERALKGRTIPTGPGQGPDIVTPTRGAAMVGQATPVTW
jgi:hypothetical protein